MDPLRTARLVGKHRFDTESETTKDDRSQILGIVFGFFVLLGLTLGYIYALVDETRAQRTGVEDDLVTFRRYDLPVFDISWMTDAGLELSRARQTYQVILLVDGGATLERGDGATCDF